MKSKNLIIILIPLLIVLGLAYLFSSEKMRRGGDREDSAGQIEIMLTAGQEKKVGDLVIKMKEIFNDKRCAIDKRCVLSGKEPVDIELRLGAITGAAKLNIGGDPYMFEKYLIKLVNFKMEKVQDQEIVRTEYIATFSIKIMDGNAIEEVGEVIISDNSGIKGSVMMGPICPVQRVGDDSCNDKPVKTSIIIKDKKEGVVKSIETLDDGSFSVNLSPGNYVIYTDYGGNFLGGSKPEYVTVEDGKFAEVTIRIDTGIR